MADLQNLLNLFNGTAGNNFTGLRLEGLHYVYVADTERYEFVLDGVVLPSVDANTLTTDTLAGRYAQGLMAAPSTRVYNSVRNKILLAMEPNSAPNADGTGGTATGDQLTLASRMAQITVAACIANGTGVRGRGAPTTFNDALGTANIRNALYGHYKEKILRNAALPDGDIVRDIASIKNIVIGFEAVNEAYANFFHTNHHNASSTRFSRGIRFAYVAAQEAFNCRAIAVHGIDLDPTFARRDELVDVILRDVVHDTRHDNVAELVYGATNGIGYPVTDHNRFSFSNAPAGLSDISAAVSILNAAGSLLHTDYADAANALNGVYAQIQYTEGLNRFRYSPFSQYVRHVAPDAVPPNIENALALAGALAVEASDVNNHDACPFFADTQFNAIAVRKRSTPGARATVLRHIGIKAAATAQRRNVTAAHPDVTARINAAIAQEINDLVI